jgi:N-acetylmuramic acid 6-phosphate etherase
MRYAAACGAYVIGVTCSPDSPIDRAADIGIAPYPGPEVVTGSTRMKCGTAQKMVLNMLTTCTMIKMGKVYGNLMVDVSPTNEKLMYRCVSIICTATGCSTERAKEALEKSGNRAKTAIVMVLCDCGAEAADRKLEKADGQIDGALRA